jgi:hypothetical protein
LLSSPPDSSTTAFGFSKLGGSVSDEDDINRDNVEVWILYRLPQRDLNSGSSAELYEELWVYRL